MVERCEPKPCAICTTAGHAHAYLKVSDLRGSDPQTLLRCSACGLVYVDEPQRIDRPFTYDEKEGSVEGQWAEQFPDELDVYDDESWGVKNQDPGGIARAQYATVARLVGDRLDEPGFTLAELGAARGYLLAEIARHHPTAQLIGVDPSPAMTRFIARTGARVVEGVVEADTFQPGSLDAVFAFGSFIQVRDPRSALQALFRALKPGGVLCLDSPNDASLFRALMRLLQGRRKLLAPLGLASAFDRYLRLVYNPGRFYYYTPKTYSRLLADLGFEVFDVELAQPRYLASGKGEAPAVLRAFAGCVSLAERISGRQSWVRVAATRMAEPGDEPPAPAGLNRLPRCRGHRPGA